MRRHACCTRDLGVWDFFLSPMDCAGGGPRLLMCGSVSVPHSSTRDCNCCVCSEIHRCVCSEVHIHTRRSCGIIGLMCEYYVLELVPSTIRHPGIQLDCRYYVTDETLSPPSGDQRDSRGGGSDQTVIRTRNFSSCMA